MKILITGGAGYIGSHLNQELSKLGHETIVFDNLFRGHEHSVKWGKLFVGDLLCKNDLRKVFSTYNIDCVFHLAGTAYVEESTYDPELYYRMNVVGSKNLFDTMLEYKVKKIIFSSSCATYGQALFSPITEDHIQNPINTYGFSKLIVEKMLQDYNRVYGLNYCIFRYFNVAGSDETLQIGEEHFPETHLIPSLLLSLTNQENIFKIYGNDYDTVDGSAVRDYIHVVDLVKAHIKGMDYILDNPSDIFNLGTGTGYSIFQIIQEVEKISGKKVNYEIYPRRNGDSDKLIASYEKAHKILNWSPVNSDLQNIVKTAWNWINR